MSELDLKEITEIVNRLCPDSDELRMMRLSTKIHEKVAFQFDPDIDNEVLNFVVYNYPEVSPFYYPYWKDRLLRTYGCDDVSLVNEIYEELAEEFLEVGESPFYAIVYKEKSMFGNDGYESDEDDADEYDFGPDELHDHETEFEDYYLDKYRGMHAYACDMWEEKLVADRLMFEESLKAWVGLFVPDASVSEHYYQIMSDTLSDCRV